MSPRTLRVAGPVILVVAALAAAVVALYYGGGADPLVLGDPGPVVRWGLPIANLGVNLGAAAMAGSLVLALFALRAGETEFDTAARTGRNPQTGAEIKIAAGKRVKVTAGSKLKAAAK